MAKILLLSNLFPTVARPSGAPFISERIVEHRAAGHQIDRIDLRLAPSTPLRLILEKSGRDVEDPTLDSAPFIRLTSGLLDYQRMHRSKDRGAWARRAAELVSRRCLGDDYDVIHAHGMYRVGAGLVAQELSERTGIPYAVTIHGSDLYNGMHRRPSEFRRALRGAHSVMYVSAPLRDAAVGLGAPLEGAVVTGNGVDLDTFTLGSQDRDFEVLFVGNLASVKGADRLPAIFRRVSSMNPRAKFTIIGVGALRQDIEEATSGLPVSFLGAQNRRSVAAAMRRASVQVLPSRSEGWPTVINEALASGTAIAATNVGGVAAALDQREWLVDPGANVEERMARLISLLLEFPPDRSALRGRAEKFSWTSIAAIERQALGI
ncbi:glycosyltransferase [Janibacter sp. GS2]|uniref:glycosyltransferase n=1 Tax=Janibacter sp. GS2 TaxID=3442646 RepID=UPI003EBACA22